MRLVQGKVVEVQFASSLELFEVLLLEADLKGSSVVPWQLEEHQEKSLFSAFLLFESSPRGTFGASGVTNTGTRI